MRIVLVGHFGQRSDEGMRGVCETFAAHVSATHEVLTVSPRDFCTLRTLPRVRRFEPDYLHYLTGPTVFSLIALRIHQASLRRRCTTIATGLRPYLSSFARRRLPAIRPDWFLSQARRWERSFAAAGSNTLDLPNPVDTSKFHPVDRQAKSVLRASHGLETTRPIVLHVGHVKTNRNLEALLPLQESGAYQVVVVGSESYSKELQIRTQLERAGARVLTTYQPRIEELYQLADFYAFPVLAARDGSFPSSYEQVGCIDMPLTILEALACGLPVVATEHDAARYFLGDRVAIEWFDGTADGCAAALARVDAQKPTRDVAEEFDTRRVCNRLDEIYDFIHKHSQASSELSSAC